MDKNSAIKLRYNYCGPISLSPLSCLLSTFNSRKIPNWEQLQARSVFTSYRCRTAINLVLPALGIEKGSEVLVPAYNCGSEIDAILSTGASVRFFDVNSDTKISIDNILSSITSKTKAIYIIHYFGWPQKLEELRNICDQKGIVLIEDCAHALFSSDSEGWIGRYGDASFFSLMKSLPVPDGAIAIVRKKLELKLNKTNISTTAVECVRLIRRSLIRYMSKNYFGVPAKLAAGTAYNSSNIGVTEIENIPDDYFYNESLMSNTKISPISLGIVNRINYSKIIEIRRCNYKRVYSGIIDLKNIRPLFSDLPQGVCPLVFPLIVSDRNYWMANLSRLGAHPIPWWSGYHPLLIDGPEFQSANMLKNKIVAIPVHQELSDNNIDYIIACIRKISKASK